MSAADVLQPPAQTLLGNLFRNSSADRRRARRLRARTLTRTTSSSVSTQCDFLPPAWEANHFWLPCTASPPPTFHSASLASTSSSTLSYRRTVGFGVSACTADFHPISSTSLPDLGNQRCFSPRLFREVANSNLSSPLPDGATAYIHSWPPSPNSRRKKAGQSF